jgi:hypothetical protein
MDARSAGDALDAPEHGAQRRRNPQRGLFLISVRARLLHRAVVALDGAPKRVPKLRHASEASPRARWSGSRYVGRDEARLAQQAPTEPLSR